MDLKNKLDQISSLVFGKSPIDQLRILAAQFPNQIVFSTSFGWEDQVITDLIFTHDLPIEIFTLDTGRLFPETHYVWNQTLNKYKKRIKVYSPANETVQEMLSTKGPNSFYESIENRKECCHIRKIEPLKRALTGNKIWVTGIRSEQSLNREEMQQLEWDEGNQLLKFHPIISWSLEDVKAYVRENNLIYNTLHDKGFPSIGCQPCTRSIGPEDDFRSGRWWWEDNSKKECGLHS